MKKFFSEFREFISRGNVIDLAVGIIIGGAFGKITASLVSDIIMPPVGLLIAGMHFQDLKYVLKPEVTHPDGSIVPAVSINYGMFLQTVIDFLIIALAIFLLVKAINTLRRKQAQAEAAPADSREVLLLSEIRDALKGRERGT